MKAILRKILPLLVVALLLVGLYWLFLQLLMKIEGDQQIALLMMAAIAIALLLAYGGWKAATWWSSRGKEKDEEEKKKQDLLELPQHLELVEDFNRGVETLYQSTNKTTLWGKRRVLYEIPWVAVLGGGAVGKSDLLSASGLFDEGAIDSKRGGARAFDWWFSSRTVFLDVSGSLYSDINEADGSWAAFMVLLRRKRIRAPLNGVVLCLDVQKVLEADSQELNRMGSTLRRRISRLYRDIRCGCPVILVLTKLDCLPGFSTYFGQFSAEELKNALGVSIPPELHDLRTVRSQVGEGLAAIVAQVWERLPSVLLQLEQAEGLDLAMEFPLQLENLTERVKQLVGAFLHKSRFEEPPAFRGLYLSASHSDGPILWTSPPEWSANFSVAPATQPRQLGGAGAFFVRALLTETLSEAFSTSHLTVSSRHRHRQQIWISSAIGALLLGLVSAGISYAYFGLRSDVVGAKEAAYQAVNGEDQSLADVLELSDFYRRLSLYPSQLLPNPNGQFMDRLQQVYFETLKDRIWDPTMLGLKVVLGAVGSGQLSEEDLVSDYGYYYGALFAWVYLENEGFECSEGLTDGDEDLRERRQIGTSGYLSDIYERIETSGDVAEFPLRGLFLELVQGTRRLKESGWFQSDAELVRQARLYLKQVDPMLAVFYDLLGQSDIEPPPPMRLQALRADEFPATFTLGTCAKFWEHAKTRDVEDTYDCVLGRDVPNPKTQVDRLKVFYVSHHSERTKQWLDSWAIRDPSGSLEGSRERLLGLVSDIDFFLNVFGEVQHFQECQDKRLPGFIKDAMGCTDGPCAEIEARIRGTAEMVSPELDGPSLLRGPYESYQLAMRELATALASRDHEELVHETLVEGKGPLRALQVSIASLESRFPPEQRAVADAISRVSNEHLSNIWSLLIAETQRSKQSRWEREVFPEWQRLLSRYPFAAANKLRRGDRPTCKQNVASCDEDIRPFLMDSGSGFLAFFHLEVEPYVNSSGGAALVPKRWLGRGLNFSDSFLQSVPRILSLQRRKVCDAGAPALSSVGGIRQIWRMSGSSDKVDRGALSVGQEQVCWHANGRISANFCNVFSRPIPEGSALRVYGEELGIPQEETLLQCTGPWHFPRLLQTATDMGNNRFRWSTEWATKFPGTGLQLTLEVSEAAMAQLRVVETFDGINMGSHLFK